MAEDVEGVGEAEIPSRSITPDGFYESVPRSVDRRVILALTAITKAGMFPSGSGVAISHELALTAAHVVTDYPRASGEPFDSLHISGQSGFSPEHENRPWAFGGFASSPHCDLALLVNASGQPPIAGLVPPAWQLVPPRIGDRVVALGFAESDVTPTETAGAFRWTDSPTISRGYVLEVFPGGRDSSIAPFPCFAIDTLIPHGVSGGPVFNDDGHLVGVACSGSDLRTRSGAYGMVSLLWPALLLTPPLLDPPLSLYERAIKGELGVIGLQLLQPGFTDGRLSSLSLPGTATHA